MTPESADQLTLEQALRQFGCPNCTESWMLDHQLGSPGYVKAGHSMLDGVLYQPCWTCQPDAPRAGGIGQTPEAVQSTLSARRPVRYVEDDNFKVIDRADGQTVDDPLGLTALNERYVARCRENTLNLALSCIHELMRTAGIDQAAVTVHSGATLSGKREPAVAEQFLEVDGQLLPWIGGRAPGFEQHFDLQNAIKAVQGGLAELLDGQPHGVLRIGPDGVLFQAGEKLEVPAA